MTVTPANLSRGLALALLAGTALLAGCVSEPAPVTSTTTTTEETVTKPPLLPPPPPLSSTTTTETQRYQEP